MPAKVFYQFVQKTTLIIVYYTILIMRTHFIFRTAGMLHLSKIIIKMAFYEMTPEMFIAGTIGNDSAPAYQPGLLGLWLP
jgi:hypothetical protein